LINRNQGAIAEALAERLRAGASLGQTQLELIEATSQAWIAYDLARTVVETYREVLLPKTRRTLELTEQAYRSGKFDYLRLLDAQQVFVETNVIYLDALLGLHQAASELESLMQIELGELNAKDTFTQPTDAQGVSP
ncbi:MAG: TolC family protein, partial [Planctomycetota bacterium]|nr:TolC family protein [Planctomycetota bacterium]